MKSVRVVARIAGLTAATLGLYLVRLVQMLLMLPFPRADRACRCFLLKHWARLCSRILGMRVSVQGPAPKPPFFLVTNHLTYLDGLVLAGRLGCIFIAKSEIASWPVVGFLAKQVNVIFIDRQRRSDLVRVNNLIARTLAEGEGVVMFAESTTSRGTDVQPFKTALFQPAVDLQLPVHYAALSYSAPPGAPPASAWITWWTDVSFGAHLLGVMRGSRFNATLIFGEAPIFGADRKILAEQLHDAVRQRFIPVE